MKSIAISAIIFIIMFVMIVESRPSNRLPKPSTTTTTQQPPESENEIDQPGSCRKIRLPFRQNVQACSEMVAEKFPYGCFMMKFSFGLNTVVCFTPNNEEQMNDDKEQSYCHRIDWPLYNLDGTLCLSYKWAIPALF